MHSHRDPHFSEICGRVGNGTFSRNYEECLKSRLQNTDSETENKNFKNGNISICLTTNRKRQEINESKLNLVFPNEKEYISEAIGRATNLENAPEVPANIPLTKIPISHYLYICHQSLQMSRSYFR